MIHKLLFAGNDIAGPK